MGGGLSITGSEADNRATLLDVLVSILVAIMVALVTGKGCQGCQWLLATSNGKLFDRRNAYSWVMGSNPGTGT